MAVRSAVCIFGKFPSPGATKSRLAATVGDQAAAALSKAMLLDLAELVLASPHAPLLYHPPGASADAFAEIMPSGFRYAEQRGDDLGERMAHTFSMLLDHEGYDSVIIVGSDCIACDGSILAEAQSQLQQVQVVLQPAHDGGYTLVGQSRFCPNMFADINWGEDSVYQDTVTRLDAGGVTWAALQATFDVDTWEDLAELSAFVCDNPRRRTQEWLEQNYPPFGCQADVS